LELKEERRKQREFKKFSKVIMNQKAKDKLREEAKTNAAVAKWRNLRKNNEADDAFEVAFEKEEKQEKAKEKKPERQNKADTKDGEEEGNIFGKKKLPNKRRQAKNARYATYKKKDKRNTKESVNDFIDADRLQDMRRQHQRNARTRKPKGAHKPVRHKRRNK